MASKRSASRFRATTTLVAASLVLLPIVSLGPDAGASTTLPIALQQFKVVSYMPVRASWTNMWSEFDPTEIQADFQKVAELGANTVRIAIDPFEFGWPIVTPQMASELSQVLSLAQAQGLYVQLTLFDWWSSYSQISPSESWLSSLLRPYNNDHEIAFIELQNEIDPDNPAAMAWARAILPAAKAVAGDIPLNLFDLEHERAQWHLGVEVSPRRRPGELLRHPLLRLARRGGSDAWGCEGGCRPNTAVCRRDRFLDVHDRGGGPRSELGL